MSAPVNVEDWMSGYYLEGLDRDDRACYCQRPAHGRTVYWTGRTVVTRYQCREHLPVEPAMYQAVTR